MSCDRPLENCAVMVPSLATVTPVMVPKGEPLADDELRVEAVSYWVMPVVPPTAPRLIEPVWAARPVVGSQGIFSEMLPVGEPALVSAVASEPSELNCICA